MNRLPPKNEHRLHFSLSGPSEASTEIESVRQGMTTSLFTGAMLALFIVGCSKPENEVAPQTSNEKSEEQEISTSPAPETNSENAENADASKELLDGINSAISMIETKPDEFLSDGILHPILKMRLRAAIPRYSRSSSPELMNDFQLRDLQWHLESSLKANFKFNADESVVVARYPLTAPKKPVATKTKVNPFDDRKPSGPVPGLGGDLKTMLTQAAALVESGKLEEFTRSVYPIADVARFEDQEEMQRHLERIQNESMIKAMARDLKAAAAATPDIQGDSAMVSLSPIVDADPKRQFKFEKVDGHWRFIDSDKAKRLELVKLISNQSEEPQGEPTQGVMTFTRTHDGWRILTLPTTE